MNTNFSKLDRFGRFAGITGFAAALALVFNLGLGCDVGLGSSGSGTWGDVEETDYEAGDPTPHDRGAADNDKTSGWQDRGQDPGNAVMTREENPETGETLWTYVLNYRDIILSPDGANLLVNVPKPGPNSGFEKAGMVLAAQPLPKGEPKYFPQLQDLMRINFSPDGKAAYLLGEGGRRVWELNLSDYTLEQELYFQKPFSVLDVSRDGMFLVLSNLPKTDSEKYGFDPYADSCTPDADMAVPAGGSLCQFGLIELATGTSWTVDVPHRLRDIDTDPVSGELLIAYSKKLNDPAVPVNSFLTFYSPVTKSFTAKLQFQNCADEVVINEKTLQALQSPTVCAFVQDGQAVRPLNLQDNAWGGQSPPHDPISVIDLSARKFVENLPGFGPVAVTEDGKLAAGFTLKDIMKAQWGYAEQQYPVGIILVDLPEGTWEVIEYGSAIPAYTFSPDGKALYLYSDNPESSGDLARLDVATRELYWLNGPSIDLEAFVWSPAGDELFTVSDLALYHVRNGSDEILEVDIPVEASLINIRPQGDFILVAPQTQPSFFSFKVPEAETSLTIEAQFDLELQPEVTK